MILKVCGLRDPDNIEQVLNLRPDWIGLIFYPKSSRFVGGKLPAFVAREWTGVRKAGVFVNESTSEILATAEQYGLDGIQLHGQESPGQCAELRAAGFTVIKAFSVGEEGPGQDWQRYEGQADFFLFDTKGRQPGGNGVSFDWKQLADYQGTTPYFLSGGLGPEHAGSLSSLALPGLAGFDLNSKFETRPGLKDPEKLRAFFQHLRQHPLTSTQ